MLNQSIREDNREFVEVFKQGAADRQKLYELQLVRAQNESRKLALQELREDNKIMAKDLSSITDPLQLQYYQSERSRIWEKRNAQASAASASADDYLQKFGSSLDDFSED
ncbi:hypothetical protein POM88_022630 [Heracleum sosnowskyi]|uniref:No apical meristem-associated C-terminal domain-containing protein n=1 Tax=Heracleum sosnowskyi TaxID=360622 RepID=A0AAD8IJ66_9APIA|nr:hypothetical protein POM88_022630 [Heracleum sosnowskyi]